ncbi:MAG: hypothetical protein Q9M24_02720 [Mariprofundaceae bacterium]|nr:hypothetical protein [Mariprofundaceae bacterium]
MQDPKKIKSTIKDIRDLIAEYPNFVEASKKRFFFVTRKKTI